MWAGATAEAVADATAVEDAFTFMWKRPFSWGWIPCEALESM
jgi:hypothetical protein